MQVDKIIQKAPTQSSVLLVEDDVIAQKVHKLMLEKLGFIVDTAIDGKQALVKCFKKYCVIFLDCGLPDLDGFEICRCIRQYEQLNEVKPRPIIMLSAYPFDEEIQKNCNLSGITEFIAKPVELHALSVLISRLLSN